MSRGDIVYSELVERIQLKIIVANIRNEDSIDIIKFV